MSAMSSKHVTVGLIKDAVSGRHALLRFCLISEMHWTNWHIARHPPAVPNQARCLHNNRPFHHITDACRQKYYYIWIESFAIGSFFILKFRLTLEKFSLFILHLVQLSSKLFHLHFRYSLCLKNFNYHIYLKNMYIKCLFSSNKIEELFTFPQSS